MNQKLTIAGREFSSRLLLGTGKFSSNEAMRDALDASGAPIAAGATVWAAGPWLPELFPQLVGADAEAQLRAVAEVVVGGLVRNTSFAGYFSQ